MSDILKEAQDRATRDLALAEERRRTTPKTRSIRSYASVAEDRRDALERELAVLGVEFRENTVAAIPHEHLFAAERIINRAARYLAGEVVMTDVREYAEGYEVTLRPQGDRLVVHALNEGSYNCTLVDLIDLIAWLRVNRPELLDGAKRLVEAEPTPDTMKDEYGARGQFYASHRSQIERVLGRPLHDDELVRVASLAELTPAERAVATVLAKHQLVLCALYLHAITPSDRDTPLTTFIDELRSAP